MPHERDPVHLWDMLRAAKGIREALKGLSFMSESGTLRRKKSLT